MISFLPESWFPKKQNSDFHTPDRWWISPRIIHADLYVTIKEFYEIIYSKHEEKLNAWLVKLEKFNIPELQTYVNGIRKDIVAVKNGIAMQYNNGLAEGNVNKLKVIKRIMYGRNSFELLKAKVLLHEQFRCEIN